MSLITHSKNSFIFLFLLLLSSLTLFAVAKYFFALSSGSLVNDFRFLSNERSINSWALLISSLSAACLFAIFFKTHISSPKLTSFSKILIYSLISFLVFYDPNLYFFWDEWNLIERFREKHLEGNAISAVLIPHNEHFLPLGFLFYFFELKIFKANYILFLGTSSFLHALNTLTLEKIFEKLSFQLRFSKGLSAALALIFLISSLHAETMQWAFEQTILLSALCSFSAINFILLFLKEGKKRHFYYSSTLNSLSPFFFGGGFTGFLLVPIIYVFYLFLKGSFSFSKSLKLLPYLLISATISGAPYFLVLTKKSESTEPVSSSITKGLKKYPKEVLKYNLIGTQQGTISRGLGLYPGLSYGSAREYFWGKEFVKNNPKASELNSVFKIKDPENIFFFAGVFFSAFLFLLYFIKGANSPYLSFFIAGQVWLFLAFLLPALGRWEHGYPQALSLRYQYFTLPGFLLCLAPLLNITLKKTGLYFKKNNLGQIIFLLTLFIFSFLQFKKVSEFNYFTEKGLKNRAYLEELEVNEALKNESSPLTLSPNLPGSSIKKCIEWVLEN